MADADPLAENWVGIRQPAGISQLLMVDQIFFFKLCHRTFWRNSPIKEEDQGGDNTSTSVQKYSSWRFVSCCNSYSRFAVDRNFAVALPVVLTVHFIDVSLGAVIAAVRVVAVTCFCRSCEGFCFGICWFRPGAFLLGYLLPLTVIIGVWATATFTVSIGLLAFGLLVLGQFLAGFFQGDSLHIFPAAPQDQQWNRRHCTSTNIFFHRKSRYRGCHWNFF